MWQTYLKGELVNENMNIWVLLTEDLSMWTYLIGVSIILDNGLMESMQQTII